AAGDGAYGSASASLVSSAATRVTWAVTNPTAAIPNASEARTAIAYYGVQPILADQPATIASISAGDLVGASTRRATAGSPARTASSANPSTKFGAFAIA